MKMALGNLLQLANLCSMITCRSSSKAFAIRLLVWEIESGSMKSVTALPARQPGRELSACRGKQKD